MKTMESARGGWFDILTTLGIEDRYLVNRHGPCPLCMGGKDRFRWDDKDGNGTYYCNQCGSGDGMDLLMNYFDWDFKEAAWEIDKMFNGQITKLEHKRVIKREQKPTKNPLIRLRKVQAGLRSCDGINPVRLYLRSRGLKVSKALKYHPGLPCYNDGKWLGDWPAMVAKVTSPSNDPVTFHITYLTSRGEKAPIPTVRKILPVAESMVGAAIRLTKISDTIAVTEGIETALAVMAMDNIPTWSLINAGNMQKFIPPPGVKTVIIYADNDANGTGQEAARILETRLTLLGIKSVVNIPETIGTDFAD